MYSTSSNPPSGEGGECGLVTWWDGCGWSAAAHDKEVQMQRMQASTLQRGRRRRGSCEGESCRWMDRITALHGRGTSRTTKHFMGHGAGLQGCHFRRRGELFDSWRWPGSRFAPRRSVVWYFLTRFGIFSAAGKAGTATLSKWKAGNSGLLSVFCQVSSVSQQTGHCGERKRNPFAAGRSACMQKRPHLACRALFPVSLHVCRQPGAQN